MIFWCGRTPHNMLLRIPKYKYISANVYTRNWSESFVLKKIENTVSWTYVICDLKDEKTVWSFREKELGKKQIKQSLELK